MNAGGGAVAGAAGMSGVMNQNMNVSLADSVAAVAVTGGIDATISDENRRVLQWVGDLVDPQRREAALMELSKKREQVPELALIIWHSFGMSDARFCFLYNFFVAPLTGWWLI